jgi:general secretion pathway protein K
MRQLRRGTAWNLFQAQLPWTCGKVSLIYPVPPHERGAALLVVLLLVTVMGALAVTGLERLKLSTSIAANVIALDQARAFAIGTESLVTLTIDDLIARSPEYTTNAGNWNGSTRILPMPGGGTVEALIQDGSNCFNINSVAEGQPSALASRPAGMAQFQALLQLLEVPEGTARRVAEAAGDWVDSDLVPNRMGAEDPQYVRTARSYRTGNGMFVDTSELRVLFGVDEALYDRVRPWLCALPVTDLAPINVNTLSPGQAPLLAMLSPRLIPIERARRVLAERPQRGWTSINDFYAHPALAGVLLPLEVQLQPQLRTRWFALKLVVQLDGAELVQRALIDARITPAKIASRQWGRAD